MSDTVCGKAGFLMDVVYRPERHSDLADYWDASDQEFMMAPERYLSQRDADGGEADADNVWMGPIFSGERDNAVDMNIHANTIFAPHSVNILFQGCTVGMTYEIEIRRHLEAIPDSESSLLETTTATLESAGSPLELLHR